MLPTETSVRWLSPKGRVERYQNGDDSTKVSTTNTTGWPDSRVGRRRFRDRQLEQGCACGKQRMLTRTQDGVESGNDMVLNGAGFGHGAKPQRGWVPHFFEPGLEAPDFSGP